MNVHYVSKYFEVMYNDPHVESFCSEMSINYGILFSEISINVEDKETKPIAQHI
jgi:hypothetical protein